MHAHLRTPDVCIAGAGIVGLSLALELHLRGLRVMVLDKGAPLAEASTAAAGMLASADPHNPAQLRPLADLSISLYAGFLERLRELSGENVPFQTHTTLQSVGHTVEESITAAELSHLLPSLQSGDHRFTLLDEHSLDPRQLATALLAAVQKTTIELRAYTPVLSTEARHGGIEVKTSDGIVQTKQFVDCTGSWSASVPGIRIVPKKGQMLYVPLPSHLPLHFVVRTREIYIVPRTIGRNAGRALIGATVEDAGFDKKVHAEDIRSLQTLAATLLPSLAEMKPVETWAGLRPGTSDDLPLIGAHPTQKNHFVAAGHFRNGILLAPGTARVMAQMLCGEETSVDPGPLSPARGTPAHT